METLPEWSQKMVFTRVEVQNGKSETSHFLLFSNCNWQWNTDKNLIYTILEVVFDFQKLWH